jgi:hypothetical protein
MALSDLQDIDTLFLSSKLNRLQSEFLLKPFSCDSGGDDFDKFLFDEAKYHLKYLLHVTYVLESEDKTIAYFTLVNDVLKVDLSVNREVRSELKKCDDEQFKSVLLNRRSFPAVKIGILAVGKDFQKQGIGLAC